MTVPYYGDGSELDAFEDLSIDPITESSFLKQPKVIVLAPTTRQPDVDDLIAINDLPVSPEVEALFLKAPSTSKTCYNTSNVLNPDEVQSLISNARCQEANITRAKEALKVKVVTKKPTTENPRRASTQRTNTMSPMVPTNGQLKMPSPGLPVLPLPRELRDEVYKHLLCKTYRVRLPAIGDAALRLGYCQNSAFEMAFRPRRRPPGQQGTPSASVAPLESDHMRTKAPWAVVDRKTQRRTEEERYYTIQRKRWNLASPKDTLSILQASRPTLMETAYLVYEKSTFCFLVCEPRKDILDDCTVSLMKNVVFHIDLLRTYEILNDGKFKQSVSFEGDVKFQASTLEFARRLICRFGDDTNKRKLCIIRMDYRNDCRFLIEPAFLQAIARLVGFQTVALRFTPRDELGSVPRNTNGLKIVHYRIFQYWEIILENDLGPGKAGFDREDFYSLVFHPLSHRTGSPPPEFDVKDLADRSGLFDVDRAVDIRV